jgi:hypothetical protein
MWLIIVLGFVVIAIIVFLVKRKEGFSGGNYYCFNENLAPTSPQSQNLYTSQGTTIGAAISRCESDPKCAGFTLGTPLPSQSQDTAVPYTNVSYFAAGSMTRTPSSIGTSPTVTFMKSKEACATTQTASPLSTTQTNRFLSNAGEPNYYNVDMDKIPYTDPMVTSNKILFNTRESTCKGPANSQCFLSSSTVTDLQLEKTTGDPNRNYFVDDSLNMWKVEGDRCGMAVPYVDASKTGGIALKTPNQNGCVSTDLSKFLDPKCDAVCKTVDPSMMGYRKDLNQCLKDVCAFPTYEACDNNDFTANCPQACGVSSSTCSKERGGFKFFVKQGFLYETKGTIFEQIQSHYMPYLSFSYDAYGVGKLTPRSYVALVNNDDSARVSRGMKALSAPLVMFFVESINGNGQIKTIYPLNITATTMTSSSMPNINGEITKFDRSSGVITVNGTKYRILDPNEAGVFMTT